MNDKNISFIVPVYRNENGVLRMKPLDNVDTITDSQIGEAFKRMARDYILRGLRLDWAEFEKYVKKNGYTLELLYRLQQPMELTEEEALRKYFTKPIQEKESNTIQNIEDR